MWKPIVIGTLIVAVAGSSLVYAQQRQDRQDTRQDARHWQPSLEDRLAFGEARLAALRAGLALRPDQEKNWPAFEQAAREFAKLRLDRFAARIEARGNGQPPSTDPADRLRRAGTAMTQTGAVLTKLADATDPLYQSLDDAQKKRFALLARSFGPRPGMQRQHRGGHHMMNRMMNRGERGDGPGRGDRYRGNPAHHNQDGPERGDRGR